MMPKPKLVDQKRLRLVRNNVEFIAEHLEAMQRDVHGLEYDPWKDEVDDIWKRIFDQISKMSGEIQQSAFEVIREPWTSYITHYGIRGAV